MRLLQGLAIFAAAAMPAITFAQATFNVQSSGRGLENAKMNARMQQLHDNQQAVLDVLQPQSFAVLPDCDGAGEKISWNASSEDFACVEENDPTVYEFAKDPLPTCNGTEFLQGDGTSLSCVDATAVVTGAEIDPTVEDFAKNILPTCGVNEALKGNGTSLSCVAISGAGVESDPTVYSFAQNPLPTCGAGQVLKADGTSFSCVADTSGGFTETDPLTMSFAKSVMPVCAADEVLSNTDGSGLAFECVDAATAAAGAADNLGNHTATQNLDMATFAIIGLKDPSNAQDAVTKAYLDTELSSGLASVSETDPTVEDFAKIILPTCAANQLLSGDGTNLSCVDASSAAAGAADNLGNHTATENIVLGNHYINGDADSEGLSIDTGGRATLSTLSGSVSELLTLQNKSPGISSGSALVFRHSTSRGAQIASLYMGSSGVNHGADFIVSTPSRSGGGVQERMRITESGNVGIGIEDPLKALHVQGDIGLWWPDWHDEAGRRGIYLLDTVDTDHWGLIWGELSEASQTTGNQDAMMFRVPADRSWAWIDENDNVAMELGSGTGKNLYVAGSVGVGTTSPSKTFHVYGPSILSGNVWVENASSNVAFNIFPDDSKTGNLNFVTTSSARTWVGDVGTKGWNMNARGDAFTLFPGLANDFALSFFDGTNYLDRINIEHDTGNFGIGVQYPLARLHVGGGILSAPNNEGSSSVIDFSAGNVAYTSANCGGITLQNMLSGGSYSLVVKGTASATCSFSHSGLTFKYPPGHGATEAGKHTVYSFLVAGSDVYVTWIKGY